MENDRQAAVVAAIGQALARKQWNSTDLARNADLSVDTVGDLLNGRRWPRAATLAKVEAALGWEPGVISASLAGSTQIWVAVGGDAQDAEEVLLHLPAAAFDGLPEVEREEVIAAARLAALEKARQIRAQQ